MVNKSKQKSAVKKSPVKAKKAAPARTLSTLDDIERLFENWVPASWLRPLSWDRRSLLSAFPTQLELKAPNVDIIDRDAEIVVRAEIPGIDKKDLNVSVNGRSLTIKGKSESKTEEEKGNYYRREISQGSVSHTVRLPEEVDGAHTKSTFKDGLLELRLPKAKKSQRQAIRVE